MKKRPMSSQSGIRKAARAAQEKAAPDAVLSTDEPKQEKPSGKSEGKQEKKS